MSHSMARGKQPTAFSMALHAFGIPTGLSSETIEDMYNLGVIVSIGKNRFEWANGLNAADAKRAYDAIKYALTDPIQVNGASGAFKVGDLIELSDDRGTKQYRISAVTSDSIEVKPK